jgi:hypothetical protein
MLLEAMTAAVIAKAGFSCYSKSMEPTPYELTPKQQGILATLSRETGKPIPALLDEALEVLQEQERLHHPADEAPSPPAARPKSLGEIAAELFGEIPEEELARLPVDGAAQHDHYIYGLPKRSL